MQLIYDAGHEPDDIDGDAQMADAFEPSDQHQVCKRCRHGRDSAKGLGDPFLMSAANHMNPSLGPAAWDLPAITQIEEQLIAIVHVFCTTWVVGGPLGQHKYKGNVIHFLREVGRVYKELPLIPTEVTDVILRPSETDQAQGRMFAREFTVRCAVVAKWLDHLKNRHPLYRDVVINPDRIRELPEDGNVLEMGLCNTSAMDGDNDEVPAMNTS
ncbi:hypothetical protein CLAFUW4_08346 [Fulvia fulva]|uniref:DUF6570 domain-containing protein n=1 Tax=Passalora fulva TaxID=5499 RepID=A0A9Q8P622_PASFU|nr:uncharacterized protein CLAFUR5_08452 [Fulvia fulva]KAK4629546.1 hypothetical protein CLAFUR4_08351 [Fulvia fulva]KAK4629849.1 hypothetical protein CLAFUR0_08346 [Fulvia fulva]UJO14700.1 hypothetical protein CLAFUR5_08452 [Fulvia fulva]WPV12150.1 hypothetical protein CLAFUW4_08346 [Fulvia fulva]WPV27450.1 hypothetical protein CLAFUW7_08346 [Fulvia fulva]